jgi:hypothetical protein
MLERLGPGFTRKAMGQWVGESKGPGLLRPVHQEHLDADWRSAVIYSVLGTCELQG